MPRFLACLAAVAGAWAMPASAQSERPLRILVGYPAGGTADLAARLVGDKLRETLRQTVVIENKPGAGGRLVMDYARSQPADGTTLVVANSAVMTIAPLVYRKLNYDIQRDFTPVAQTANFQLALATGPGTPAKSLKDYVSWIKASPDNNSYASPALGSIPHFFGLMIGKQVGVNMLHIPFNGSAPLMSALVGGQVPASVDTLADLTEMHRAGKIRVLATSGTHRSVALPDVPTFTELGYKDIEGEGRYGFLAPAGTPRPVLDKLNAAIVKAVQSPDLKEKFLKLGLEPKTGSSEAFSSVLAADAARWAPVVKASGYTGD
ncbi:Bug family tripartite tricarboxylate transporter substrate binding protein [Cupriavidus sp. IDO]|uniref:Bug family tripartite tricarboxylate transporter substrate binding protein n=1 Tax=Cupriavidus sp. IDO TaxID=1539142 RepID=UPI00068C13AD|nr:ABC transporter substrate-binding protein [Cupriavidus sp. IDO]